MEISASEKYPITWRKLLKSYGFSVNKSKSSCIRLLQNDSSRTIQFLADVHVLMAEIPDFYNRIFQADEWKFTKNSTINRRNCRTWAQENSHVTFKTRHLNKCDVVCLDTDKSVAIFISM